MVACDPVFAPLYRCDVTVDDRFSKKTLCQKCESNTPYTRAYWTREWMSGALLRFIRSHVYGRRTDRGLSPLIFYFFHIISCYVVYVVAETIAYITT